MTTLTEQERHRILYEWNDTRAEFPDVCVQELFEQQVARDPGAVAVVWQGQHLTYGELNQRANQVAHFLRGRGVGPEVLVGVALERTPELVIALLGVWKAGGAYVPLDPAYPQARLSFMVGDADVRVLLTAERCRHLFPSAKDRAVCLDSDWPILARESTNNPKTTASPTNLAYVMYTSGSTGQPKGAMILHRGLANYLCWAVKAYAVEAGGSVPVHTSVSFDLTVTSLFPALLAGGRVELVPEDMGAQNLLAALRSAKHRTLVKITPSHLELLGQQLSPGEAEGMAKTLVIGGENLLAENLRLWRESAPATRLINEYGPTETVVGCCVYEVQAGDPRSGSVPIGRPIANTQLYVLDPDLHPVPPGVVGELYVGGAGVARGYLNRPELTRERFLVDPFSDSAGARMYKTGDLARFREDGILECLGRVDDQVKVRGYRIELGEIEATLAGQPDVRSCAVLAREDTPGDKQLVGYVVSRGEASPSAEALRTYLNERLPEYMAPSQFVFLDSFPLTPNGKIDRKALPAPSHGRASTGRASVAPRTETEKALAVIWAELLNVESVGVNDDFFDLGGHSLLAIKAVSRIRDLLGVEMQIGTLFEHSTIEALSRVVSDAPASQAEAGSEFQDLLEQHPGERYEPFPLTDIQEAYWIGRSSGFDIGNVACHAYREVEIDSLDLDRYEQTWQRLIDRHDMLRAIVRPDGQQQVLQHTPPLRIQTQDLSDRPAEAAEAAIAATRQEMSHQVLPSDRWPLFEIRASKLDRSRYRIHSSFDLLIGDVWSSTVLQREFDLLYADPHAALPPLEISFRDYVLALARFSGTAEYRRSLAYWDARLPTLPARPELPLATNPGSIERPRFARRHATLDPDIWSVLQRKAEGFGLTQNGVFLAAFADVLATWSRRPRFLLTLTLFNRLPVHPQVNDLVGDFTSLTLLDVELLPDETFPDLARKLLGRLWKDLDHRFVSGVQVLRRLIREQPDRLAGAAPVVLTSTLGFDTARADRADLARRTEEKYVITQTPQVWIDQIVGVNDGRLAFDWYFVEQLFPPGLVDDMFEAYVNHLKRLAREDAAWLEPRVVRVGKLVPEWQCRLRESVNATAEFVPDELLHVLFEHQATITPERIAIVCEGVRLTYSDVAQLSRRLGRQLRELGALPNSLVAIVMEKGWEQVVAALGILQSGAAYVPIDATLPQERRHQLLEDSGARFVLTQPGLDRTLSWPSSVQTLRVERMEPGQPTVAPLAPAQRPEDLAYVIYTSGSTGLPKGVMIDHRGAVNTIIDMNRRFGVGADDCVLALSSLSFDLSVYDIFGMLAAGGAIVIPESTATRDPERWAVLMHKEGVTIWNSVPALMEMLVEYVSGRSEALPPALRLILLSGDWIPVTLPDQIRALSENVRLMSLGGATEASIWSILYPIEKVDHDWKSIPYGRPMVNQTFHVLDDSLEPCPAWVTGQLYIGGIGLAKGYWRDEEKTSAKFILHPRSGERLYSTGDLGRYLPSGDIEFLGREDSQVKIRGFRIELGEIEAAIRQHPAVRSVVVTAVGKTTAERRLIAYVVLQAEDEARAGDGDGIGAEAAARLGLDRTLLDFLADKLPEHMCPSRIMLLDHLPLTPNGKVDLRSLPAPEAEPAATGMTQAAPRNDTEAMLVHIWQDVLHVGAVGINDSFFDLGGDSVNAIQVVSRVGRQGQQLSPVMIFRYPTIAELALRLAPQRRPHDDLEEITL